MLTLTMKLGLRTKQVDYSNAFVQADIDGDVYCELPMEFSLAGGGKSEYVLQLKKSLYGLKQAPLLWFKPLEKSLLDRGFKASKQDPRMFMKKELVAFVYVDDVLFFGTSDAIIDEMIATLKKDFDLKVKEDVFAFLGIEIIKDKKENAISLRQQGLVNILIQATGTENANKVKTPAMMVGLGADVGGRERRNKEWSYASVVRMLLYLAGNTRPDIAFDVYEAAQFSLRPMQCHEDAVKRIVRYLIGTRDEGLYFGSKMGTI